MAPVATRPQFAAAAATSTVRVAKRVTVLHPPRPHWAPWRQPAARRLVRKLPVELVTVAGVVALTFALLRAYDRSTPNRILPSRRR